MGDNVNDSQRPTAPPVSGRPGGGQPWASVQVLAAVPVKAPQANGLRVVRTVTPLQEKVPGQASRGDVWRVRLSVEAGQDVSWVALNDPIPAGARILGEGSESDGRDARLAGPSGVGGPAGAGAAGDAGDAGDGSGRDPLRLRPAYVERSFGGFRAYYAHVPRGRFHIDYTLRLNNAGEFALPATRVEAMYAPEVFGEAPNARVKVGE